MFGKIKDLYNLQKQAKQMKAELQKIHIEAEIEDVKVTMNGEMDIVNIDIQESAMAAGHIKLANNLKEALTKARKKAEQIAADKMKDAMGGGFPGLS